MNYSLELDVSILKAVIEKLQQGKESTLRLQTQIQKPFSGRGSGSLAGELEEIADSFSDCITLLKSSDKEMSTRIAGAGGARRGSAVDRSSKGSDQNKKRLGVKDRRGCYRRRNSAESRVQISSTAEDGLAWRKYGQKEILNTDFPRCYFRCTHKTDQNCKATKQVQKLSDDPPEYQITYFGHHTCQTTLMMTPQIIPEPEPMDNCSHFLNFETKTLSRNTHLLPPPPPPISPTATQEFKEETHSDVTDGLGSSMWRDMGETSGVQKVDPASNTTAKAGASYNDQEVVSSFHSLESFANNFDDCDGIYMDDMAFSYIGQFRN